ncbi:diacylglycerol kinase family protein [Emticicia sp. BO119]|uniref:diacylglycerol/lipid kinase family protein n=1 Tax=Emticicia sp. BO119 TaxID=2757768 RepID=UPI0015F002B8|nr:diacylglycerol kinase family protein [Emticicia sp. BO119]MBA4851979.1 diacylglycerol kinase family lipid kinase [Emticicia sp. BO119]
MTQTNSKILFIVNPVSGRNNINRTELITDYFKSKPNAIQIYELTKNCNIETIKEQIKLFAPEQVVGVGGDGTIKLVAECLLNTHIKLGIFPAGSANGMAAEFKINAHNALDVIAKGYSKKIHLTNINSQLCIHLSDIGLNAYAMKRFNNQKVRGMWGYFIASLKVLMQNPTMEISMHIDKKAVKMEAEMIVIANATKYGTGAVINPVGRLDDELFEVVVIKKISFREVFKMIFTHKAYDLDKTEVFQTTSLSMHTKKRVHFQIDGEYLGKIQSLKVELIANALDVVVPEE